LSLRRSCHCQKCSDHQNTCHDVNRFAHDDLLAGGVSTLLRTCAGSTGPQEFRQMAQLY
jgi:hypothetical protein